MKFLLCAVNSQYIHSNLAVYKLSASTKSFSTVVHEFNINQQLETVFSQIVKELPEIVGFSCYIWNIEFVLKLASSLKKALPDALIVLGGPEVSFSAENVLAQNSCVDFIIRGEGEYALPALLDCIESTKIYADIPNLCYRESGKITSNPLKQSDFCSADFAYTPEMLEKCKGRILYYESSRGCPFSCSYCLSSAESGIQTLPLERVFEELKTICDSGVTLVKFVDRTFNANPDRTKQLLDFILKNTGDTRFHFEIGADLLTDELMETFGSAPAGKIQLEAGIQSTCEKALSEVCRKTDMPALFANLRQLIASGNIHVHVDLIAGLPFENFERFKCSFNEVYALHAHNFQLGFLKLLKGTRLRLGAEKYGISFRDYPPYEIIKSNFISADELIFLKEIEGLLGIYWNSGRFCKSMLFLEGLFPSAFALFNAMRLNMSSISRPLSLPEQYERLYRFCASFTDDKTLRIMRELIRFDYHLSGIKTPLSGELYQKETKSTLSMAAENNLMQTLGLTGPRELNARMTLASFAINPIALEEGEFVFAFDRQAKSPVTDHCECYLLLGNQAYRV